MNDKKEFSILKWIVFPAISLVLSGAIAYFNLRVFGYEDGLPYAVIVLMIGIFSIIINTYTESRNRRLAIAAFVFEIFLTTALIGNASYSLSVQRKMAVARMAGHEQTQTIGEISKLKGARTQREAIKKIDKSESAQAAFAQYEDTLFWIMVAELALFGVCAFTLFGIAKLIEPRQPALTEREKEISRRVLATRTPYRVRSEQEIAAEYDRQSALYDQLQPTDEVPRESPPPSDQLQRVRKQNEYWREQARRQEQHRKRPAPIIRCEQCQSPYKEAIRVPGKLPVHPEVVAIEAEFPVEAERFRSDRRNLCGDCFFNCLYEMNDDKNHSRVAPKRRTYTNGRDDSASHFSGPEKPHFDVSREPEFTQKPALAGNVSRDVSRDSEKRVSDEIKGTSIERLGYGTSESGTTIPVNDKFRLIVRSDDGGSGYRVMVAWDVEGKEKGKGPQRYICRLSREEWDRAQGMTLSGFAQEFLLPKHSARRPTDRVDQKQLDRITKFIRSMM